MAAGGDPETLINYISLRNPNFYVYLDINGHLFFRYKKSLYEFTIDGKNRITLDKINLDAFSVKRINLEFSKLILVDKLKREIMKDRRKDRIRAIKETKPTKKESDDGEECEEEDEEHDENEDEESDNSEQEEDDTYDLVDNYFHEGDDYHEIERGDFEGVDFVSLQNPGDNNLNSKLGEDKVRIFRLKENKDSKKEKDADEIEFEDILDFQFDKTNMHAVYDVMLYLDDLLLFKTELVALPVYRVVIREVGESCEIKFRAIGEKQKSYKLVINEFDMLEIC